MREAGWWEGGSERKTKKGLEGKGDRLGQDLAHRGRSVEIDRGHGVTMVVLHGTPFIRYNAG